MESIFSDSTLLKNIWSSLINKTFKQLNAERAVRRARPELKKKQASKNKQASRDTQAPQLKDKN